MTDTEREDREILAKFVRELGKQVLAKLVESGKSAPDIRFFSIGDVLTAMSVARDAQREADAKKLDARVKELRNCGHMVGCTSEDEQWCPDETSYRMADMLEAIAAAIRAKKEKP